MKRNERRPVSLSSRTSEPTMSAGMRSGVHCTRLSSDPKDVAERPPHPALAKAGHADEQRVTARQQRDKSLIDGRMLTEDHAPDALPHLAQALAEGFDFARQLFSRGLVGGH